MNFSVKGFLGLAVVAMTVAASGATDYQAVKKRLGALTKLVRSADYTSGITEAKAIMADKDIHPSLKIEAAQYLADGCLDRSRDFAAADKVYTDLMEACKGMIGPNERMGFVNARARIRIVKGSKEESLKFIESERARYLKECVNQAQKDDTESRFDGALGKVYAAFYDNQTYLDYLLKRGRKAWAFRLLMGAISNPQLADRLSREIVLEAKKPGEANEAWLWLWGRDPKFCQANLGKVLDDTKKSKESLRRALYYTVARATSIEREKSSAYFMDHETTARTWELYKKLTDELKEKPAFIVAQYSAIAQAALGNRAKAAEIARAGLEDPKIKPGERYELEMMARLMAVKGSARAVAGEVARIDEELSKAIPDVKPRERRNRFERAASLSVVLEDDEFAHGLADYYRRKYDIYLPRKTYAVGYSVRPISGADDFEKLDVKPEESSFDRKFGGDNLEFMVTDVSTGNRGKAVKGAHHSRPYPTTLKVVADEWGVHFVMTYYDTRARQFEAGELDPGSFECYIATGNDSPYTCFLCYPKTDGKLFAMHTAYNEPGYRRVVETDPNLVRNKVTFTDDSIRTYVGFAWANFPARLPADGTEWEFESVFWGPVMCAWNGEKTIHGRSTWGRLKFALPPKAHATILREQLYRAVNFYRSEKKPGGTAENYAQEGCFEHWSDPELGDVAFYEVVLKPLLAELDPVAARVKSTMTDAEVLEIVPKYLARFSDIRQEVSRLRADWLAGRAFDKPVK